MPVRRRRLAAAVFVLTAALSLAGCGDDAEVDPGLLGSPTPAATASPGLSAWCKQYPAAVVQIQTFGTFPSKDGADQLIAEVNEWARVAPEEVAAQTQTIAAAYVALGEAAKTGNQEAVTTQANGMAADPELKQAVEGVSKYYSTNCPDGVAASPSPSPSESASEK